MSTIDAVVPIQRVVFPITDSSYEMAETLLDICRDAIIANARMRDFSFDSSLKNETIDYKFFGVSDAQDSLIGFALFEVTEPYTTLHRLVVRTAYQSQGVGGLLVGEALARLAVKNNIELVKARIIPTERRVNFFKNCGFTDLAGGELGDQHIKPLEPMGIMRKIKTRD